MIDIQFKTFDLNKTGYVDEKGKFTDDVHESLRGKSILKEGNKAVIQL